MLPRILDILTTNHYTGTHDKQHKNALGSTSTKKTSKLSEQQGYAKRDTRK
jgi:hypothetical protein